MQNHRFCDPYRLFKLFLKRSAGRIDLEYSRPLTGMQFFGRYSDPTRKFRQNCTPLAGPCDRRLQATVAPRRA